MGIDTNSMKCPYSLIEQVFDFINPENLIKTELLLITGSESKKIKLL